MRINKCYYCMTDIQPGQTACPNCGKRPGEDPQPEYALPCGSILHGKYLIGAMLGQGGFGITYVGYDLLLNLKVAIKEYFPTAMAIRGTSGSVLWSKNGIPREEGCANFLKEARKMAKLMDIPEVVRVMDMFMENNTAYIVMEFVEGITLKAKLRQNGTMACSEAIELLRPVIRALGEAHKQGIIHRDISPDNIMVDPGGKAHLLDLGAAKEVDIRAEHDRQSSQLIHKDGFSPPEQYFTGEEIGAWTDVYAMCATIYYSVTGKLLPPAMERVMKKPPVVFQDEIPQSLRKVLVRGLDTDYTKRYQSMEELLKALPELTDPRESKYQAALAAQRKARGTDDYKKLEKAFLDLNGYKDSAARAAEYRQKIEAQLAREKAAEEQRQRELEEQKRRAEEEQRGGDKSPAKKTVAIILACALLIGAGSAGVIWKNHTSAVNQAAGTAVEATAEPTGEANPAETEAGLEEAVLESTAAPTEEPEPTASPESTATPEPTPAPAVPLSAAAQVGDYITFGTYEQDNDTTNGAEDIEWLVLDKTDDAVLLISRYGLDAQQYNTAYQSTTWGTCTLRTWLNNNFYTTAFSWAEQAQILTTTVTADANPHYSTNPGSNTQDNVFLLSIDEVNDYFTNNTARQCQATEYAIVKGVYASSDRNIQGNCSWWLRTPGSDSSNVAIVNTEGLLNALGDNEAWTNLAIRPALWVSLPEEDQASAADASDSSAELALATDMASANIGDLVTFGTYEQDNDTTNGAEDIEWLVLDKTDDAALLISKYALDAQLYNTEKTNVTWETCSLRSWLNSDFYNTAFSAAEQAMIATTEVKADQNPKYDTDPGKDTQDKVFLLSINEANQYFTTDEARQCELTEYAIANNAYTDSGNCWWWLRSPGNTRHFAAFVNSDGSVYTFGNLVHYSRDAVRPALWVQY